MEPFLCVCIDVCLCVREKMGNAPHRAIRFHIFVYNHDYIVIIYSHCQTSIYNVSHSDIYYINGLFI